MTGSKPTTQTHKRFPLNLSLFVAAQNPAK